MNRAACHKFLHKVSDQKKIIKIEDEAIHCDNKFQRSIIVHDILCVLYRIFQYKKKQTWY